MCGRRCVKILGSPLLIYCTCGCGLQSLFILFIQLCVVCFGDVLLLLVAPSVVSVDLLFNVGHFCLIV